MSPHVIKVARETRLVSIDGKAIGDSTAGGRIFMHHERPLALESDAGCRKSDAYHAMSPIWLKRCSRSSIRGPPTSHLGGEPFPVHTVE
jgi:hypothetical protein